MAYVTSEARRELLDDVARATDEIGRALAALGAAYEQLDEATGDRLEEQLFRPVQVAFGRARRTHAGFAQRHGLPGRDFAAPDSAGPPSTGVRGFIEQAQDAAAEADDILAELQDSMRPVEVGDPELRAGLADVRAHLATVEENGRELLRIFGR
jgi:hypothetical protein